MLARSTTRTVLSRAALPTRATRTHQPRNYSSSVSSPSTRGGGGHFASGIAGGVVAAALIYGAYYVSPTGKLIRSINNGSQEASRKYQEATKRIQQSTPNVDQAIKHIKEFCYSYVAWLPGGRVVVDSVFEDVDILRQNHGDEVNNIINDAYRQIQDLTKSSSSGLNLATASRAFDILTEMSKSLGMLVGDSFMDILDNHPQAKEQFGGSIDQLKRMGEQYGPEAKKQVDETWLQVKQVLSRGFTAANLDKARRLVEDKVEQVKKLGEEAWKTGLEQAKPYLDKNPKVKEMIEKNEEALKEGNAQELFQEVKNAIDSGDLQKLEGYVNQTVEKTKSKGSGIAAGTGLEQYFEMIPNGSEILAKVQQLKEVAEKHRGEGERLLRETMDELKEVLQRKTHEAKEIADKEKK